MAHELDVIEDGRFKGKKAMFSVGESPWHDPENSTVIAMAPSMDEAYELAGLGYEIGLRPLFVTLDNGEQSRVPHANAVVRTDRGTMLDQVPLAVVGDQYVPLQNRDAFGVLEPLIDKGVAFLETGGVLRQGRDAWMLVRFDVKDPVVQEVFTDEVVPFGLITNNHSGHRHALIMETPIRVVCANTLGSALVGWEARQNVIKVSHRGDAKVKMVDAAEEVFAGLVDRYQKIARDYKSLKERILTVEEFTENVLDVAAPFPKRLHGLETQHLTVRGYDMAREVAQGRRDKITDAWEHGKGHTGNHSSWEAYNGAVEVIDHDSDAYRTRGSRVAQMIGGRLVQKKSAVLDSLVGLARK